MAMEKSSTENFCEVVSKIDGCIDAFKDDQITFNPITKGEVFNINVASSGSRFLSIAHGRTAVI